MSETVRPRHHAYTTFILLPATLAAAFRLRGKRLRNHCSQDRCDYLSESVRE